MLKRLERLCAQLKLVLDVADVDEVRCEGSVVVWEVPLPRAATLIVIAENPAETKGVLGGNTITELDVI